jgi:nucleotide-binding universal stress UspA family protein
MGGAVMACLDDGPAGAAAARVSALLARRLCAPLMLTTAAAPQAPGAFGEAGASSPEAHARSVLLRQAEAIMSDSAAGVGPDPELRVELGEPAERLASLAQRTGARLIVIGVPGRRSADPCGLGSAHLALAGTAPCPVVAVPPSMGEPAPPGAPVVCGVDGSNQSLAAARFAVRLARSLEAPLQLVHVADHPKLSGVPSFHGDYGARLGAGRAAALRILLRAAGLPEPALNLRVELGDPAERLADHAAREGAQLIVSGSTGRSAERSKLLGSVSSALSATAAQPVVLVGARATPAPRRDDRSRTMQEPPRRPRLGRRAPGRRRGRAERPHVPLGG